MSIGLQGAYGVQGAYQSLDQLLSRRMQQDAIARQIQQQHFENQMREKQFQSTEELKRAQLADLAANRRAEQQNVTMTRATTLADQIPAGTALTPTDPAVGMLRTGGQGALLTRQEPTLPSTQYGGASTLPGAPKPSGFLRTVSNQGNPEQFIKGASFKQTQDEATRQAQAETQTQQEARNAEIARHNRAMESKPTAGGLITIQTVDENGKPVTKIVPKTAGATYDRGPNAVTANRLDSAAAVTQTGNDIIAKLSDPRIGAMVGPALGRYNTLRDFIGNPPPEFAGIAGQIESYALANMGVHGMRSAQGAQMIINLLDRKHTPQSLVEMIKGLNGFSEHFLENAGRKLDSGRSGKPSAADLIKKYSR